MEKTVCRHLKNVMELIWFQVVSFRFAQRVWVLFYLFLLVLVQDKYAYDVRLKLLTY